MEAVLLLLIGAILFSHAWYLLGLFTEGKNMGVIVGALSFGLLGVAGGVFAPVVFPELLGTANNPAVITLQAYGLLWAAYGFAVAAHGLWDFDDRPIGFYALFLVVTTLVYLIGMAGGGLGSENLPADAGASVAVAAGSLILLAILSSVVFAHLAVPIRGLRLVAGWFLLVGSAAVSLAGFAIMFELIGI